MRVRAISTLVLVVAMRIGLSDAGPGSALATYGAMQAICAKAVMSCYGAGGATWGATMGITAPPTIVACNAGFGACQASAAKAAGIAAVIPFI